MSERDVCAFRDLDPGRARPDSEVVEIPLLLAGWQADALERAAHARGLTAGEMVRSLLREFFTAQPCPGQINVN
jgi:hypothetical protein